MAIKSRYKLKTGEEVAYFPPIQNTDNPYLTEAAMHADQANQEKGYLYVVTGVGHFEYKGGASRTKEDYELISGSKSREIKKIDDITQYTAVPEDWTDYTLRFTADTGGNAIDTIINAGVAPDTGGELIAYSDGNNTLNITGSADLKFPGNSLSIVLRNGFFKAKPLKDVNSISLTGDFDSAEIAAGFKPFISKWNVAANETITLPIGTEGVNKPKIDWGDGAVNYEHSHTYATAGEKEIYIYGRLEDFRFYTEENKTKLSKENPVEVVDWGDIEFVHLNFGECTNLSLLPDGTKKPPNLINSSSVAYFFFACPITSFPKNLFDNGQNILNIESAFRGTQITAVEEGSFDQLVNIIDGANLFYTSQIVTLPPKLFANSIKLINLRGFCLQVPLTEVPEDLLLGLVSLRSLSRAFRNTLIGEIPRKFLWSCIELRDVEQMCYNSGLTSLHPETFKYAKKVEDFEKFVRNNPSFISDVPPIWMDFPEANALEAFSVGTFPNVDEIPVEWGGNNTDWATEKGNVTHIWKGTQLGYDNVLPEAWKTNEKVLKVIGNGNIYTGKNVNDSPSSGLVLGETSSKAYRGDRGKIAYDHSQSSHVSVNHLHDDRYRRTRIKPIHVGNNDLVDGNFTLLPEHEGEVLDFIADSDATLLVPLDTMLQRNQEFYIKGSNYTKVIMVVPEGTYFMKTANGSIPTVIENGYATLRITGSNYCHIFGDLVKEYEIISSPDGTLWKKEVNNSGVETITAY